jgi:hypothetical protein
LHGNLSVNLAEKHIRFKYFKKMLLLFSFFKDSWRPINDKKYHSHFPSNTVCHICQVTFSSSSHNLSDTKAYQQYTTGKIIGIKKANPPFCFNCQKKKMKSQKILLKAQEVECQFPDSATQTKMANLFTKL